MIGALESEHSKRVMILAHPDDESLFAAGIIIRYHGDWSIVCCSIPKRDPIRAVKFHLACAALGAQGRTLPWSETRQVPLRGLEAIDLDGVDLVVTHGAAGEYGHQHHKQVHAFVKSQKPSESELLTIGYGRVRVDEPSLIVQLSVVEWERKLSALKSYDHEIDWGGEKRQTWDALLCEYGTPGRHFGFDLKRECYDRS